jgi:ABC-type nitrate/sulfonate/bicarbonate transport system ATPase subunit
MDQTLSLINVSKSFGTLDVLQNISLDVTKHEFVSVIGPSGSGKSTLFHILAGVEKATTGEILIDNKKIKDRRGKFGYMPQEPSLFPWKTVLENIMLGPIISGKSKNYAKEKAFELLEKFSLQQFFNHYPSTLSGGMQQRVALLRTVLFNPSFLLLDEPFGSLDALTRQHAQIWLTEVWEKFHSSVLFITHDIQEAILLSDRIYVFSDRPSTIIKEITVNLPRPRKLIYLTSPDAVALEKKLLSLLMKENT